ncbi:hypothetical protein ACFXHD_17605 [Streptomyces hydrogenans]|uniref:hypothetical protein n=1 Tax=Streptomyces hydrogenans TaxID=1873719 RepID=UPI0036C0C422
MTHVLLPLDVFKVRYEVAVGRPYSRLEQLLLRLISEDEGQEGRTFDDFRTAFHVHDRVLTEALVTLLREGWVAMTHSADEIRYLATEEGMLTISHGRHPARLQVQQREVSLARELLSCQLTRLSDLDALRTEEVRKRTGLWAASYSLKAQHHRKTLNGGEAEWLLPRNADEQQWIRRIDPDARALRGRYCLPLQVDLEAEEVVGLPASWSHLKGQVLKATHGQHAELGLDGEAQQRFSTFLHGQKQGQEGRSSIKDSGSSLPGVPVSCADVALTVAEARRLVDSALEQATDHVLFVVSALDPSRAARLSGMASELQQRGIHVDVLWSGPDNADMVKALVNTLGASRTTGSLGKLLFNRMPAAVAADLVLVVTPTGPVAVVGRGMLSGDAGTERPSPAVRLRHVQVLSAVAALAAGWWQEVPDETTEVLAGRWRLLSEQWVEQEAKYGSPYLSNIPLVDDESDGQALLYIGSQGLRCSDQVLQSGAGRLLVDDTGATAQVVASEEEWVVGADGSVPATLGFRLLGRPAEQLWKRVEELRLSC